MADLFEETAAICKEPKKVSNWLMGEMLRLLKEEEKEPEDSGISPAHLAALIMMKEKGEINGTAAKEVFEAMFHTDVDPLLYVEEKGLRLAADTDALQKVLRQVLADNPGSVEDYRGGKEKALGFLVGQTMKVMKGKANPGDVNRMLRELLQR